MNYHEIQKKVWRAEHQANKDKRNAARRKYYQDHLESEREKSRNRKRIKRQGKH